MSNSVGRHPSGRASRATPRAGSRLGHSATIPDALFDQATPPNTWAGDGFSVYDALNDEGEVEMGQVPRWHVSVEGVGSWPVAYFYTEADARLWAAVANRAFAQRGPIGG